MGTLEEEASMSIKRLQLTKALVTALAEVTLRFKTAVHGQGRAKHLCS